MKFRNLSLAGKTVAFRTVTVCPWVKDTQREIGILKVDEVSPDGLEVAGRDDEGNNIWCCTADILRVF